MQISDLTVEVRDKTLKRVGKIPEGLVKGTFTTVHNGVGSWSLDLPAQHPLATALRTPGAGIIVTGPDDVLLSGPMTNPTVKASADTPKGLVTVTGVSDDIILSDATAWPQPSNANASTQTLAYDNRSGLAETVMRSYVNANIGPGAPAARRGLLAQKLTLAADLGRGPLTSRSARFTVLGELLTEIATHAGLGFRVVQRGAVLVFEVYSVTDRTKFVRLDVATGSLASSEVKVSPPGATRPIVLGQGQGEARTVVTRTAPAATAAEAAWGRIIEEVKDQRNTDVLLELQQAGDEILAEKGFTATNVQAIPADSTSMRYGRDWREGDRVTVVVDGQETTSTATQATVLAGPSGVLVGAGIGDVKGFDAAAALTGRVEDTAKRVAALERNAEQTIDTSARVAAGMIAMMGGTTVPSGWLLCNGQTVNRITYARLYAAIGTTYGAGNGTTTFTLPDMRGRVPVGLDTSQTEFNGAGKTGGAKTHTLAVNEMPSHNHTQNPHTHGLSNSATAFPADAASGTNWFTQSGQNFGFRATTIAATTATNNATGGGAAHNNLQPYMAMNFFIAT